MRKRYYELPEPEREEPPPDTYVRPSTSAWVATASVIFAIFILGGFIKTYRQLEEVQEASRQEIDELRDELRRLQSQFAAGERQTRQQVQGYRVQPLPPARRDRRASQDYWEPPVERTNPPPTQQRGPLRPEGAPRARVFDELSDFSEYEEPEQRKPRVQFGRRSAEESRQLLSISGTPCQVISVSSSTRRLMIEAGRDMGLVEGGRLELARDGRYIGELRILDVYDTQSSCEVLHSTEDPRPGDTVRRAQR